jgi:murein DD-endopeptidase MepM/ murein hydrolase activator NlpD
MFFICGILALAGQAQVQDHQHNNGKVKPFGKDLCGLTDENMLPALQRIAQNIEKLKLEGNLHFPLDTTYEANLRNISLQNNQRIPTNIRFAWPMRTTAPERAGFTYFHLGNFTDLATTSTGIVDYMGGARTYNGHKGIDIGIGPLAWDRMDAGDIHVIAAAPGILLEKSDGSFDENCDWDDIKGNANKVAIMHADGHTVSLYLYLKRGSVTTKAIGAHIEEGEYLGTVGSSGFSTGPHLHFEVRVQYGTQAYPVGHWVEPFAGPENFSTDVSLWKSQLDYWENGNYMFTTGKRTTETNWFASENCDRLRRRPANGFFFTRQFHPGDTVDLLFHAQPTGGSMTHTFSVLNPNQQVLSGYPLTRTQGVNEHFKRNFLANLGATPLPGVYTYTHRVQPAGASGNTGLRTQEIYFHVGACAVSNLTLSIVHLGVQRYMRGGAGRIMSTATVNSAAAGIRVLYGARSGVDLLPGFTAVAGSDFIANTEGCN